MGLKLAPTLSEGGMLRGGQFSVIITPFSWSILGYQNHMQKSLAFAPENGPAISLAHSLRGEYSHLSQENRAAKFSYLERVEKAVFEFAEVARQHYQESIKGKVEKHSQEQSKRRGKRDIWQGLTREQILERNNKILQQFRKTHLSTNRFASKHAARYGLTPDYLRKLLQKS
jgi:hypothetical protein